jgi:hypothetical protein
MSQKIENPFAAAASNRLSDPECVFAARPFMANVLKRYWKNLVRQGGKSFLTASEVLKFMNRAGIHYRPDGSTLRFANGVGDVLGKHALNLLTDGRSPRGFYMPSIEWSDEERRAFLALAPGERVKAIVKRHEELKAEVLPDLLSTDGVAPDHSLDGPGVPASEVEESPAGPAFVRTEDDGNEDLAAA